MSETSALADESVSDMVFSLKHFGVNDEVVHDVFTAVGGVFPHVEIDDLSGGVIAVDRDG